MTNPLATAEQLYRRISSFGALPSDLQDAIFIATQSLTQAAGLLLRLPQSVTARANVVLARYWLEESPLSYEVSDVSAASLFLIAKLSSHPTPPRDVCNVYAYLLSPASPLFRSQSTPPPPSPPLPPPEPDTSSYYLSESEYAAFRERILTIEADMLRALSFDTHVALPHDLAVTYLRALDFSGSQLSTLTRRVVAYLNTALLSPQLLYLTHQPNALAVAAIYIAARDPEVAAKLPECPWYEVFDVDREELGFLVVGMRSLEGLVRKRREEIKAFAEGVLVRPDEVAAELRRRGLKNGSDGEEFDEEAAMMQSLDERAERMEQ